MNTATDTFAVFILTHGRPTRQTTYKMLRRRGYTGPIYLVIDDEDQTADQYRELYGQQVIQFNKAEAAAGQDVGDNFPDHRSVVYARNECFRIARDLGVRYFLQLDDDYHAIVHKWTADFKYREKPALNLDALFGYVLDYFKTIPAVTVAFSQNGDWLGGQHSSAGHKVWMKRKAMNSFFCDTERPFNFLTRLNDDVTTYVTLGNRGDLFLSVYNAAVIQATTQQNSGGMTEAYLDSGTYVKSFYTVMYAPSCTKIGEVGQTHRRIHHRIDWNAAVPCIIKEGHRKP